MQFQPGILSAIQTAAQRHQVDANALKTIAWLESRGDARAKNPNSSASGLFQFINSTARQYGLNDPFDAVASSDAAARLTRDNARHLTRVLGRAPNPAELYLAHQQGAGGAARLLSNPNRRAADVVGAQAVRLNGGREDMTAGEFANLWLSKAGGAFNSLTGGDYTPPSVDQMRPVGGQSMQQGLLSLIGAPDTKRPTYKSIGEAIKAGAADGSLWDNLALAFNTMRGDMADPNITALAHRRMDNRESERVANATAEWLRQNGREDLAGAIEGGMISGAQAFEMMQGPGPVEGKVVGDMLVDPYTGAVIGDYRQQGAPSLMNAGDGRLYEPATGEWIMAPEAPAKPPEAFRALEMRAQAAGLQPGTPEYARFMVEGGRSEGMAIDIDPATGGVSFRQGVGAGTSARPFTEGQSKDNVYATRAEGALAALDPIADTLTSAGQRAANMDPTGLIRGAVQTPDFQRAQQAGEEFLQAILRKDTGAAITAQEQALYGTTYLPQPGDGPEVLVQKQQSRRRALEALKAGMSPDQILAQERALQASGSDPIGGAAPASGSSDPVGVPDFSQMTNEELDAWIRANGG